MSAGMAEVIAAHSWFAVDDDGMMVCWFNDCGWRHERGGESFALRAAHVAEELAKAGYGNVQEAKRDALLEEAEVFGAGAWNDAYIIADVRDDADAAIATVAWLRERAAAYAPDPLAAALADPEGHALVKAIHERKAEA